ncbi:25090_t:CDS:1, partial [Gigaspora margarita]
MFIPPVREFQSHDELIKHVQDFGTVNGCSVSIARSKPNILYLTCNQAE